MQFLTASPKERSLLFTRMGHTWASAVLGYDFRKLTSATKGKMVYNTDTGKVDDDGDALTHKITSPYAYVRSLERAWDEPKIAGEIIESVERCRKSGNWTEKGQKTSFAALCQVRHRSARTVLP